jgi:hypothetical protein
MASGMPWFNLGDPAMGVRPWRPALWPWLHRSMPLTLGRGPGSLRHAVGIEHNINIEAKAAYPATGNLSTSAPLTTFPV